MLNSGLPQRRPLRLKNFDYSSNGFYFITLCCYQRCSLFGEIIEQQMHANFIGSLVTLQWQKTPEHFPALQLHPWVLMPNHFHAIVGLCHQQETQRPKLGAEVAAFKSLSQKVVRENFGQNAARLWQRGYYDHMIRTEATYQYIVHYVQTNPQHWHTAYFNQMDEDKP